MKVINAIILCFALLSCTTKDQNRFVILHTNDLHSQIDPDRDGYGGLLRHKVLIDSVRNEVEQVALVDAGDAVQGTLYYHMYKGEAEAMMMNQLGYDAVILGNHEFDNGLKSMLDNQYSKLNATKLATNYDLSATMLDSIFQPYMIKEVGKRKFAFIGLGLNPKGMISSSKCKGVVYHDPIAITDSIAYELKSKHEVDMVIALSHLGYVSGSDGLCTDEILAKQSRYLDIIIGGHTHLVIDPANVDSSIYRLRNADGKYVLVAQTGSRGAYLGEISIDLETLDAQSKLIAVDGRLDSRIDESVTRVLLPYLAVVDSLLSIEVTESEVELPKNGQQIINLVSDFIKDKGEKLIGEKVDLSMMNRGGIRNDLPQGTISKGDLMMTFPFDNYITVIEVNGKDLKAAFDRIAQRQHISVSGNTQVLYDADTRVCLDIIIDGKKLDENKTYMLATIDYLAEGGDYLESLANGKELARSQFPLIDDLIEYLLGGKIKGMKLNPENINRIIAK